MKNCKIIVGLLLLLTSVFVLAQDEESSYFRDRGTFNFRVGGFFMDTGDKLDEDADYYDYQVVNYRNIALGLEYDYALSNFLSVSATLDIIFKRVETDHWENFGDDRIKNQGHDFGLIPMTATLKLYPMGNGMDGIERKFIPWFGGGIGGYGLTEGNQRNRNAFYSEWLNEWIYFDDYEEDPGDFQFGSHVAGGFHYKFSGKWNMGLEFRYTWVEAYPQEGYYGVDPLDCGGMNLFLSLGYGL